MDYKAMEQLRDARVHRPLLGFTAPAAPMPLEKIFFIGNENRRRNEALVASVMNFPSTLRNSPSIVKYGTT